MTTKLLISPIFLFGLVIRMVLIIWIIPQPVLEWFSPFLSASVNAFSLDPWSSWLQAGGATVAFPYGYAMWVVLFPLAAVFKWAQVPLPYAYGLTLLLVDYALLLLMQKMIPGRDRAVLVAYWLSPIIILATYVLGLNDLIPVFFLVVSLLLVRQLKLLWAGILIAVAVSAKLSMVLSLPFFFIYLLHNRSLRQFLPQFIGGLAIGGILTIVPFLFSSSGISMLLSNPEMGKAYQLAVDFGGNTKIYLLPLAYLLMLYASWRIKRLNFELFYALLGIAFLSVVLLTPASPGWFIWAIPLLVTYQAGSDRVAVVMTTGFSILYILSTLVMLPDVGVQVGLPRVSAFSSGLNQHLGSFAHTMMVAAGLILALRVWRESVSRNDYFRLSRKPFVIGIAGDSGAGKDTFASALRDLFGRHSVAMMSGDDYHLWDRQKPLWQVMTHLNPLANDLDGFSRDLAALLDGKNIQSRHYDHQSGRMSKPFTIKSNDFIIASGLHALYTPMLRECYDLSIYLDIDEGLRRHFKMQRDVQARGHTVETVLDAFARREPDSVQFIRPQSAYADLNLSLQPIHPHMLDERNDKQVLRYKLVAWSRHGLNERALRRVLVGVCGLHVDVATSNHGSSAVGFTIEGESSAQDIELAARLICPQLFEFLDIHPKWEEGVLGLMQLVTLSHIHQVLTKRFL